MYLYFLFLLIVEFFSHTKYHHYKINAITIIIDKAQKAAMFYKFLYDKTPFLITQSQHISYRDFFESVTNSRKLLIEIGVKKGDHIAISSLNSFEYLLILMAL